MHVNNILSAIKPYSISVIAGLLYPLAFAPFHWPFLMFASLALLYSTASQHKPFLHGFIFGFAAYGFGVSWVFYSIRDFGHIHPVVAVGITLAFVAYLSIFPALQVYAFSKIKEPQSSLFNAFLFAALIVVMDYGRAHIFTGFPWLLVGYSQIDNPLSFYIPVLGVYGTTFLTALISALLCQVFQTYGLQRLQRQGALILLAVIPFLGSKLQWTTPDTQAIKTSVIQQNLSMRDKWDEQLFWTIIQKYRHSILQHLDSDLIILPESAIPLPPEYLESYLEELDQKAREKNAAIILGIPLSANEESTFFYNALRVFGAGEGDYLKQHLVPFGEYLPKPFQFVQSWAPLQALNIRPGEQPSELPQTHSHAFASVICYELAYENIIRKQIKEASWILSISDDGWFGHSLASYQQQQMAQVRSLQTGRFQVMANNDGLSSIIDAKGNIQSQLPAFTDGILQGSIYRTSGTTPWVRIGNIPVIFTVSTIFLWAFLRMFIKQRRRMFRKTPTIRQN